MTRRRAATVAVVVTLLLAIASGCSTSSGSSSDDAAGAVDAFDLTAGAVQYREDAVAGIMKILLTNGSGTEVVVQQMRLAWPGLQEVADAPLDYPLRPGETAALKVPFGSAVCDSAAPPTDGAEAVLTLEGFPESRVPVTYGLETLTRLHDADCTRRELEDQVTLSFAPAAEWALLDGGGQPVLRGRLLVERGDAEGDVVVDGAQGSVVLEPSMTEPATSPWLTLPPEVATGEVPVDVTITGRCGGHVLGEVKKPYEFEFFVDVGQGLQAYSIASDQALQDRLRDEVFFPGCGVT